MLRSLSSRNYRCLVSGHAVSVIGTWMERVAQDWLVLELTDSAVGSDCRLSAVRADADFRTLGGVLVDRMDRRRLIIGTQIASAVLAAVLATVVLAGVVELWMVYALALGLGFVTVIDSPARQAASSRSWSAPTTT